MLFVGLSLVKFLDVCLGFMKWGVLRVFFMCVVGVLFVEDGFNVCLFRFFLKLFCLIVLVSF